MTSGRNVVVFCLDTVRKDVFDEYASRLHDKAGVVYENCRAASSWTSPSVASAFTGDLPSEHGVHKHDKDFSKLDAEDTFFGDVSHRTVCVSANVFLTEKFGMDTLVDQTVSTGNAARFPEAPRPGRVGFEDDLQGRALARAFLREAISDDHTAKALCNAACEFVKRRIPNTRLPHLLDDGAGWTLPRSCVRQLAATDRPSLLFVNLMDAHEPLRHVRGFDRSLHDAPNSFTTRNKSVWELLADPEGTAEFLDNWRGLYRAAVDYLDRKLARAIDRIRAATERETTVVVTADHGENLGYDSDDGFVGHVSSLTEALLHVPLLVVNPPESPRETVSGLTSKLDLGRLVAGLAAGRVPDITRETARAELIGLVKSNGPPANEAYWDRTVRCLYRSETEKVVWDTTGTVERVACPETSSQSAIEELDTLPDDAEAAFDDDIETARSRARQQSGREVSEETRARLENVGYA